MTSPIAAVSALTAGTASSGTTTKQTPGTIDPTTTPSNVATAKSSSSLLDPQAFLQLLVAQLKYQDPSNPVDTSSFMNQTAMLSQVQTMSSMSTTLSSLADAQQAQAATGLIGKQITYANAQGFQTTGVVSSTGLSSTGATLTVGHDTVPLANVLTVSAAPTI